MTRRALLWASLAPPPPTERAPVAFHYQAVFDERALAWYSRFDVLVLGGILEPQQIRRLRSAGARRLLAYEWSSAFYAGDAVSAPLDWQQRVQARRWALTTEPVTGGAAEGGRGAIWYDYANPDLRRERAQYLAARLLAAGYDGIFLDTLGFEQLPPPVRQAHAARHPGVDYNLGQSRFLQQLRRLLAGRALFLNQGYRQPDLFLPYADFDLTESYFTALDNNGGTLFRPWHDAAKPWESVKTPIEQLILPASRRFPNVRFVHLNYAAGSPELVRQAAFYSFACAKLFNHDAYLMAPGAAPLEEATCYFLPLGRPLEPTYQEASGRVSRRFEGGTVEIEGARGIIRPR
jgi:hypothetical protein